MTQLFKVPRRGNRCIRSLSTTSELFTSARETCGWISIDPFRLYPGAEVHEARARWEQEEGAVFYEPEWWYRWADGPFHAQHIDPSHSLSYADRVRFMVDAYGPMVAQVQSRFRGQGRSVDRVYAKSMDEQRKLLGPTRRDQLIRWGERARTLGALCSVGGGVRGGLAAAGRLGQCPVVLPAKKDATVTQPMMHKTTTMSCRRRQRNDGSTKNDKNRR